MRMKQMATVLLAVAAAAPIVGCQIDQHKNGDNENVKIATPFGGLQVKTNGAVAEGETGIDLYPGAVLIKKDHDHDDGAADVNLSFGKFSLRVKAASYHTPDSTDKVLAFYRGKLTKYGVIIQCSDNHPVGQPDHTPQGLTCDNDKNNHISVSHDNDNLELKVGSKQHQHIVAIDPDGSGTKIGLVSLDLPTGFSMDDSDDDSKPKSERKQ